MDIFKQRLRELRGESKQSEIATILGTSVQNYSAFENGREPNYDTLVKISKYFDVSIDYLLGKSDYKNFVNVSICETTGLNEEAVETLIYYKDDLALIQNILINSNFYISVLQNLAYYLTIPTEYESICKALQKENHELRESSLTFMTRIVVDSFETMIAYLREEVGKDPQLLKALREKYPENYHLLTALKEWCSDNPYLRTAIKEWLAEHPDDQDAHNPD